MATVLDGKGSGKEASNEPQPCTKSIRNTQEYMEEVQKYPVLYDKFSKDFKDKYKKQNAWSAIATTFGVTPEAEKRYKSIRTSFGRYLKKKKTLPTGTGRKDVPYIAEYENLDWLKTFIQHRDTITNINIADESSLHVDVNPLITDDSIVADDENSVSSEVDCTSNSDGGSVKDRKSSTSTRKRPWSKCVEKVTKQQLDEALFKGINNISKALSTSVDAISMDEGDEDTLFCKSIVPQLKRLQPPMKQQAKIQIQQILFNCEFQHPWQAQPTSPTIYNK